MNTARQIAEYMHHQLRPAGWDYLPYGAGIVNTRTGVRIYWDIREDVADVWATLPGRRGDCAYTEYVRSVDQALTHLCAAGVLPQEMSPAYRAGLDAMAEQVGRLRQQIRVLERTVELGDARINRLVAQSHDDSGVIHPSARIGYELTDKAYAATGSEVAA